MCRIFFCCLVLVLECHGLLVAAPVGGARNLLSLSGSDWWIHPGADGNGVEQRLCEADYAAADWIPATVPGNIQADLESAHLLEPLWYGAGDPRLKDVAMKDWWYRKDFTIPSALAGKRLTLVFDGVDYQCEVWLNGQKLGANVGMFQRFWFDVTAALKPGATNQLAVHIAKFPGRGAADYSNEFKSGTNLGWDWGAPINTLGIWKDVRLEATGPARIDWTRVETCLNPPYTQATVRVTLTIDSTAELSARARVRVRGPGPEAETTVAIALRKGPNAVQVELPLSRPALWWPAGQGAQPLYQLETDLLSDAGGEPIDQCQMRFGVRDLRWEYTEGAPADFINRFQLVINGRPVRTIGSNLIPADLLFGRMAPRTLFKLRQAKAAGMNTIRIWGGGVILHESAYDLADELGLLLIQEFPMFHYWPPKDAAYLARLEGWSRNIVRQVRNHPSIIEFDGGNEMPWRSDTDHPAFLLLKRVVAEEDGRSFRAACPDLGSTHGAWDFSLWPVWVGCRYYNDLKTSVTHQGQPLRLPTMRAGEFGSAAPAHLEVWHREIPPQDQWPIIGLDNEVLNRKKTVRAIGPHNWLQKNLIENEFGPFDNLTDLIEAGQFRGAEGLRYAMDALRRMGRRIGGMTTWDLNEPWPNGAGSYLVDYDGRPNMTYDFLKQAIAPVSLSLKYDTVFYPPEQGIATELFLTSDSPQTTKNLRWQWLARDRRGTVFARDAGKATISPLEVKSLGLLALKPPGETVLGPVYVELRLEDEGGTLLTERLHIFAAANLPAPFANLVQNHGSDTDDEVGLLKRSGERPFNASNIIYHLPALGMTPPPPSVPSGYRESLAINDGWYGNDYAWSDGWFLIPLRGQPTLGRFRFGRDRTGVLSDRCPDYVKIETSCDSNIWQTVFEQNKLTQLPGFSPSNTVEIQIQPVKAAYLRVTLIPPGTEGKAPFPVIDEFEVYAPATNPPTILPRVAVLDRPEFYRPLRHTALEVQSSPVRIEGEQEVLELKVKNIGAMTAFPCEVHPLLSYRTDLFIDNNHCFIPPGESRMITIRADRKAACGLSLGQTGWWISSWNADRVGVAPSEDVLLAVGRRDQMCREFRQTESRIQNSGVRIQEVDGSRPDPAKLPYRLDRGSTARFEFPVSRTLANRPARLRIHTADQSKDVAAIIEVAVNGKLFKRTLPVGIGLQKSDPAHLAFPATADFGLPAGTLQRGKNVVEIRVKNRGWFTWDSLECAAGRDADGECAGEK